MSRSFAMPTSPDAAAPDDPLIPRLLRVAWMGVLLGLIIEVVLLLVLGLAGKMPPLFTIAADTAQKVTWSTLICAALAAAQTLGKVRALGMVTAGLLGAPIAFMLARSAHKAVNAALGAEPATQAATPWLLAGLKGAEYAVLGLLLIWLAKRARGAGAHALTGIAVGLVFVGALTWLLPVEGGLQPALMRAINEVLHPMGCALVIYFGSQFGMRLGAPPGVATSDDN